MLSLSNKISKNETTKSQFNITILSFIPALPESGESKLHRDREDKKMDAQFNYNHAIRLDTNRLDQRQHQ